MATIINLTPHTVNVMSEDGSAILTLESEGVARVSSETRIVDTINGVPVTETLFGEVTGLPTEEAGTFCIVSRMVASAAVGRGDLLVPGLQVRDNEGRVVGCKSLDRP